SAITSTHSKAWPNEKLKDRRRRPCLVGKFPRDVRLYGLRLLRCRDRARIFPHSERIHVVAVVVHDVRDGIFDALFVSGRVRRLHRSSQPAQSYPTDAAAKGSWY